jgi:hypothetical protein
MKLKCLCSMSWNSATDRIRMFRCSLELQMSVACKWCKSQEIYMLLVCDTHQNTLRELPLIHLTLLVAYNIYCVIIGWNRKDLEGRDTVPVFAPIHYPIHRSYPIQICCISPRICQLSYSRVDGVWQLRRIHSCNWLTDGRPYSWVGSLGCRLVTAIPTSWS